MCTHPIETNSVSGNYGHAGGLDLNLRQKLGRVNRSEDWLEELCRRVPPALPDYPHVGGPDDAFLKQIATAETKPSLLDPRIAHIGRCPYCLRRIMQLREENRSPKLIDRRNPWAVAIVVCCMMLIAVVLLHTFRKREPQNFAIQAQTLDLSLQGTVRGSAQSQTPVIRLPRNVDQLRLILPIFSEGGPYSVKILKDRDKQGNVAEGNGSAIPVADKMILSVKLDLRAAEPGIYFLSTTHGSGAASYYYPVEVVR